MYKSLFFVIVTLCLLNQTKGELNYQKISEQNSSPNSVSDLKTETCKYSVSLKPTSISINNNLISVSYSTTEKILENDKVIHTYESSHKITYNGVHLPKDGKNIELGFYDIQNFPKSFINQKLYPFKK